MRKTLLFFLFASLLTTGLSAQTETVVGIIVNSEAHDTLEAAVIAAGLDDDLSGDGPFTVFAPTDDAFAALPAGTVEALLADSATLANILLYHVAGVEAVSDSLTDGQKVTTLEGSDVRIRITEDGIFVNQAEVTMADLDATNGVVHVIDAVLDPPPATVADIVIASEAHDTLEAAVIAAGLADDLMGDGPFTVFAPTDDAFAALPAGTVEALLADSATLANILLYHVAGAEVFSDQLSNGDLFDVLNGSRVRVSITDEGVFVNDAEITMTDIIADNGVVHVIDAVLDPAPATVADIIIASEEHDTLEAAVIAAMLDDDLAGEGPFTVFAPTDAAFAALEDGLLDALLADPTDTLATILLFHVASGEVFSSDLSDGLMVESLEGQNLNISITDEGAFVEGVRISVTDLLADNGVVHVIDAVLLPLSVGTDEPAFAQDVKVMPNPTTGFLRVELPLEILGNTQLTLRDMNGRTIQQRPATRVTETLQLDGLANGIYLLEIRATEGAIQRRISVQR